MVAQLDGIGAGPSHRGQEHGSSAGLRQRRTSSSSSSHASAAETLLATARAAEQRLESALLVLWEDLPAWRRDNAFILTGYRAASGSYAGSARSLLYLHNESVNIWTHLVGAVVFPAAGWWLWRTVAPRYRSASPADVLVFACFFAGAAVCLGMSAAYHTICNHSEHVARTGNKLDYSGIVCLIVGSYVPALYYGLFCKPELMTVYLYGICVLGLACGLVSWIDQFRMPRWRPYRTLVFVGLGVSGVLPICQAIAIYGYDGLNERMGLNWVLLQGFLYIFGAFLYAFRWPERSFPGIFDIWGSSHQLFHVLILLAAAAHLKGMTLAFDHHHSVMGAQC